MNNKLNKILLSAALLLINISAYYSNSIATPLLTTIGRDLNVDVSLVGMVSSVAMVSTGVALLCGNLMQRVMKHKWILVFAVSLCAAGNLIITFSDGFAMLLISRAAIGFSIGLGSFATIALVAAWLNAEQRGYYFALQAATGTMGSFAAMRTAVPLMTAFGGWRSAFAATAVLNLTALLVWMLCWPKIRKMPAVAAGKSALDKRTFLWMIRRKDVLIISAFFALITCAHTAVSTYLAAYMELVREFDLTTAAALVGYASITGMFGGPIASMISAKLGRRKPVLLVGMGMTVVCLLLVLNLQNLTILPLVLLCYGFFGAFYGPVTQTITTELPDTTAQMASTAHSIITSSGCLASIFAPLIMSAVVRVSSMQAAMYTFVLGFVIAAVFAVISKETGNKARHKSND